MSNDLIITPVVTIKDGKVFANSRDVAEFFGKQHAHVLRDVDGVSKSGGTPSDWFIEGAYYSPANDRLHRCFDMTRDGFMLLVMGYTGPKAF